MPSQSKATELPIRMMGMRCDGRCSVLPYPQVLSVKPRERYGGATESEKGRMDGRGLLPQGGSGEKEVLATEQLWRPRDIRDGQQRMVLCTSAPLQQLPTLGLPPGVGGHPQPHLLPQRGLSLHHQRAALAEVRGESAAPSHKQPAPLSGHQSAQLSGDHQ
jgi:hypothetical protein